MFPGERDVADWSTPFLISNKSSDTYNNLLYVVYSSMTSGLHFYFSRQF